MRAIKLCHEDRCIFGAELKDSHCEFLKKNMDSFMVMYRTQGSTFWLRFVLSFRNYIEDKFISAVRNPRYICYCIPFIKVLNYIFINMHKKLIEGSNTSVKKYINNLNIIGLNSPQYKKLEPSTWMTFLKESKQIHKAFNNVLGLPDLTHSREHNDLAALVYTVYADYFSSLCSVFELWYFSCDLTEEEAHNIDTKIIYWLPTAITKPNIKKTINYHSSCFEKYLADYWKEDLQKMILTENIHHLFSSHNKHECCENYDIERNIFNIFGYPSHMVNSLFKIWNDEILSDDEDSSDEDDEEEVKTVTEISLKELCVLHPRKEKCSKHKNCFIKINHEASCLEPYVCNGSPQCVFTCQTNLQKEANPVNLTTFWKKMSVKVFPVNETKQDVSTEAESCRNIETYYQAPSTFLRRAYTQCITELYNFDFNPRKTECVKRLRKKLRDKHSGFLQLPLSREDFKDKFFRINLMQKTDAELIDIKFKYCVSKREHLFLNSKNCLCFTELVNSISNESTEVYGRVVNFEKTTFSVPVNAKPNCLANDINDFNRFFSSKCKISNSNLPKNNSKINVTIDCKIGTKTDSKGNGISVSEPKNSLKSDSKNKTNVESSYKSDSKINSSIDSKNSSSQAFKNISTQDSKSSSCDSKSSSSLNSKSNSSLDSKNSSHDSKSNSPLISKSNSSLDSKSNSSIASNSSATIYSKNNSTASSKISLLSGFKNTLKIDNENIPKLDSQSAKSNDSSFSPLGSDNKSSSKSNCQSKSGPKFNLIKDIKVDSKSDLKTSFEINGIDVGKDSIVDSLDCYSKHCDSTPPDNASIKNDGCDELDPEKFDAFLKFIKIDKCEDKKHINSKIKANEETALENFFNLIGLKEEAEASVDSKSGNAKQGKLKICAFCQKKEIEKKTFKRCSKCKEENFLVQRYYCSRECLKEDWNESHQAEHLRKQKHCS